VSIRCPSYDKSLIGAAYAFPGMIARALDRILAETQPSPGAAADKTS
jgi:hypothetical protein